MKNNKKILPISAVLGVISIASIGASCEIMDQQLEKNTELKLNSMMNNIELKVKSNINKAAVLPSKIKYKDFLNTSPEKGVYFRFKNLESNDIEGNLTVSYLLETKNQKTKNDINRKYLLKKLLVLKKYKIF
ncbi:lipoprotein 17-related variable surface protein [Metamycoplasma neophronis]|uniref:Lipoprotein-associated type-17 domain-containing protein n=1 Tax=Metamycoplasma neophronis TaxID=872983 RepID=A0ABY2Z1C2_9BACT|nr:lipoprotein 17-related variable surface protein [Metamycoplasma neophronis]TPR54719.1 hypothetical protein FJR74_00400 [Metamycoplasma neophronis]